MNHPCFCFKSSAIILQNDAFPAETFAPALVGFIKLGNFIKAGLTNPIPMIM